MTNDQAGTGEKIPDSGVKNAGEFQALSTVISALSPLPAASKLRIVLTVATFFEMAIDTFSGQVRASRSIDETHGPKSAVPEPALNSFSEDRAPTPKTFLLEKKPQTDVERIACLAYYLTHYRDQTAFKTLDLSKLNTEAAQIKFANAAKAVDNASRANFLIAAGQGKKQISAIGELYVQALPDRAAARQAAIEVRRRRPKAKARSPKNGNSNATTAGEAEGTFDGDEQ